MNIWQWWSWYFLILQLVQAEEIPDDLIKENILHATPDERQRKDLGWINNISPSMNDNGAFRNYITKRHPILSRWGGQRLSDLLYFKRRPAFSSWGGKRGPAFSSWGGKRSISNYNIHNQPNLHNTNADLHHENGQLTSEEEDSADTTDNIYKLIKNTILNSTAYKDILSASQYSGKINQNENDNEFKIPLPKPFNSRTQESYPEPSKQNHIFQYNNEEDGTQEDIGLAINDEINNFTPYFNPANKRNNFDVLGKRAAPSFNSWGGKRSPIPNWKSKWFPELSHWQGKKATAFNSWGGKRTPAFNSWGGKRATAFNSWGGKRSSDFDDWRENEETNNWSNNEEENDSSDEFKPNRNLNRKRRAISNENLSSSDSNETGDDYSNKHHSSYFTNEKRATAFNSWGGKRAPAFNSWGGKRAPAFNSWGGKRAIAFNSWGGKRAPAFNSWGGKRAPAFNSWGGKRTPTFNSWGGKRATAFNSWGGKRAAAFNSWGGKRPAAFNSWGGKRAPAFNSWGGKRTTELNNWKEVPIDVLENKMDSNFDKLEDKQKPSFNNVESNPYDEHLDQKRTKSLIGGKRLPAFHSWGGNRYNPLTLSPHEIRTGYLDYGFDQTYPHSQYNYEHDTLIKAAQNSEDNEMNTPNYEYKLGGDYNFPQNNMSDVDSETSKPIVKRSIQLENEDQPGRAFYALDREDMNYNENQQNMENIALEDMNDYSGNRDSNDDDYKLEKRDLETKYNPQYLLHYSKTDYLGKRRPIFASWGGKRNVRSFENDYPNLSEEKSYKVRNKRYIGSEAENAISLVMTGNGLREDIPLTVINEIYSAIPNDMTICCIKRAQYGDRNLFMQMLLRTKSFKDLSWPTIRPIRRGADFYPWGGKRSLL